jgi:glycosyltransferase involved in cell wall biosynthesis
MNPKLLQDPMAGPSPAPARPGAAPAVRVLFVIPGEEIGSSMIFARRQVDTVRAQGIDVRVFYLRSRTSPAALLREYRRFRRERNALRPQVVHAHYGTVTALFSALAARGLPLVITFRGGDLNPATGSARTRLRGWVGRMISQMAALWAQQIVCVSPQLKQRLHWRRERVVVLPSGVDADVFYPRPRHKARRRLGWTGDDPVILFNASYNPGVKRVDLAQAAVAAARRVLPELRLEMLDGGCPPELVPTYMNASDCLLVTSDNEGSPTVVQEALACNLPVVSVDVGDVRERLSGVRGTCIAARDPQALADALLAIVANRARSDGRRKVDEFSSHRVAARLGDIYRRWAQPARELRTAAAAAATQTFGDRSLFDNPPLFDSPKDIR